MSSLKPQGGLGQLLAQQGADAKTLKDVAEIEATPGGMELLYTMAAERLMVGQGISKKDAKKIRLYRLGGPVHLAKGGSVRDAAETTRRAGRGDDSMMLHVSPDEYDVIEKMWGKAEINPNTGIGEYGFLSKVWKKVKKTVKRIAKSQIFQIVAPIALSIFVPGLGAAIGGVLTGGGTGAIASAVGNAVVQGGLSAAGGGDFVEGAIKGAVSGGLGEVAGGAIKDIAPGITDQTANVLGASLASGAGAELTGGDFVTGAIAGGMQAGVIDPMMEGIAGKGQEMLGLEDPGEGGGIFARKQTPLSAVASGEAMYDPVSGAYIQPGDITPEMVAANQASMGVPGGAEAAATAAGAAPVADPTVTPGKEGPNLMDYAIPALLGAGALTGGSYEEGAPPEQPAWMNEPLPIYESEREFIGPSDPGAYYQYGQQGAPQSGEQLFITPDPFAGETGTPTMAQGPGPAGGLGGSDPISRMIAAGQVVPGAMVGPGAGAQLPQAGYTQDPNTGDWMPPAPELGQGLPQARGGYQRGGEYDYWSQNADVPRAAPSVAASGRYVKGEGTGRSDDIPARLSDGEYVMDSESVALLGDGSGDAGAKRLDEMRRNLRKHKSEKLSEGGFSHKAKQPHQYMAHGGMASLRRAMTEAGSA